MIRHIDHHHRIALITMILLTLCAPVALHAQAQAQAQTQVQPRDSATPLSVERLYHGVNRTAMIRIDAPPRDGTLSLILMQHDGDVVAGPYSVRPGRLDLADRFPRFWSHRDTLYLQLLIDDEPFGSALVIQPMLSRPTLRTEQATRPDGVTQYTRIVGWGRDPDAIPPADPPDAADNDDTAPSEPDEEVRHFTGYRIYIDHDVMLRTDHGDIRIAMRPDEAPNTAWNFLELARGGFYRDVIFHRIVPATRDGWPFVIQAGDPSAGGSGGPGYWLPIEPSTLEHDFGVISMARADHPDSAGSQFFICLSREGTSRLDGQYCAFGYAVDGALTIQAIAETRLSETNLERPAEPPMIRDAIAIPAPPRTPGVGRPDQRVHVILDDDTPPTPVRIPR